MVPWREAWHAALYGPRGFYRRAEGPAGHFTTSTHGPLGAVLAEALGRLADREGCAHVLDLGAGRGELLTHLHRARPDLALTGADVVTRPDGLPEGVGWLRSPGGAQLPDDVTTVLAQHHPTLVVAHEWLDVVPCTVAEVAESGDVHQLLVDPATGVEALGSPLTGPERDWCARHWPADALPAGTRIEVGLERDRAWAALVGALRSAGGGVALAVDYGHERDDRPAGGTLTGYREGRVVDPVPDGSCDLTAHVAVDSLEQDERMTQRTALRGLGISADPPPHDLARTDPPAYLAALSRRGAAAALTDPAGLGAFHWVLRRVPGRMGG